MLNKGMLGEIDKPRNILLTTENNKLIDTIGEVGGDMGEIGNGH